MYKRTARVLRARTGAAALLAVLLPCAAQSALAGPPQVQLETTLEDFFQPGTQPNSNPMEFEPIVASNNCEFCHGGYLGADDFDEPFDAWKKSLMGQSARDPVWHAALAIANQDAEFSGEFCIRCHSPGAWLAGRSAPADTSGFIDTFNFNDYDGVTCHFCHRSVDPVLAPGAPPEDVDILADLTYPPGGQRGNGRFVVDPDDVRRGPFDDVPQNQHGVPIIPSQFHQSSDMCATCHDLGNPVFTRQPDGTYLVNNLNQAHPTQNPHEMFPEQTTYSEWLNSDFANGGVAFPDNRFGGNLTGVMQSCQDCHMPDQNTGGCWVWESPPFFGRPDMPQHSLVGANYWVLKALRVQHDDSFTGLSADSVDEQVAATFEMLRNASDMEVDQYGGDIKVRIINQSGHKLPTGYPEGRRMWLNVVFLDDFDDVVQEIGGYDFSTAELDTVGAKIYETKHGMTPDVADPLNLPSGPSFHLALNNAILFDNRIPPRGFTNAAYDTFGAAPVGHVYADGQYWDDTTFAVPAGAVKAVVTLYYQPMTKEYIEFLRDTDLTPDGPMGEPNAGQTVYDLWLDPLGGNKVPPVDMDMVEIDLFPPVVGDLDGNGSVGFADLSMLLNAWGPCPPPSLCPADLDCNGTIGFADLNLLLANWG